MTITDWIELAVAVLTLATVVVACYAAVVSRDASTSAKEASSAANVLAATVIGRADTDAYLVAAADIRSASVEFNSVMLPFWRKKPGEVLEVDRDIAIHRPLERMRSSQMFIDEQIGQWRLAGSPDTDRLARLSATMSMVVGSHFRLYDAVVTVTPEADERVKNLSPMARANWVFLQAQNEFKNKSDFDASESDLAEAHDKAKAIASHFADRVSATSVDPEGELSSDPTMLFDQTERQAFAAIKPRLTPEQIHVLGMWLRFLQLAARSGESDGPGATQENLSAVLVGFSMRRFINAEAAFLPLLQAMRITHHSENAYEIGAASIR